MASPRCGAAGHSGSRTVPEPLAPRRPTSFSFFLGACSRLPRPSVALYCQLALCLALSSVKWANSWLSVAEIPPDDGLVNCRPFSGEPRRVDCVWLRTTATVLMPDTGGSLSLPVTSLQKEFWDPQGPGVSTMQETVRGERGLLEKGLVHAASAPRPSLNHPETQLPTSAT